MTGAQRSARGPGAAYMDSSSNQVASSRRASGPGGSDSDSPESPAAVEACNTEARPAGGPKGGLGGPLAA
jgi:hypothetical protein